MGGFDHVKPGDPVTADGFNAVAEALEAFLNLDVPTGGSLRLDSSPNGKVLMLCAPREVMALLSGSSSPYSWQEVEATASGAWATFGVRAGTNDAHEINSLPNLGGKVV